MGEGEVNRFLPPIALLSDARKRVGEDFHDIGAEAAEAPRAVDVPELCDELEATLAALGLETRRLRAGGVEIDGLSVDVLMADGGVSRYRRVWLDVHRCVLVYGRPFPDMGREIPSEVIAANPEFVRQVRDAVAWELVSLQ
jgi:hypothetical protein